MHALRQALRLDQRRIFLAGFAVGAAVSFSSGGDNIVGIGFISKSSTGISARGVAGMKLDEGTGTSSSTWAVATMMSTAEANKS